jgi:hypothetical protein
MLTIETYEFISHNINFENHKKLNRHNVALAFATMLVTTKESDSVATPLPPDYLSIQLLATGLHPYDRSSAVTCDEMAYCSVVSGWNMHQYSIG